MLPFVFSIEIPNPSMNCKDSVNALFSGAFITLSQIVTGKFWASYAGALHITPEFLSIIRRISGNLAIGAELQAPVLSQSHNIKPCSYLALKPL